MIDAHRIEEMLKDSLFDDGEDTSNAVIVEGTMNKFGFHPERIATHRDEVIGFLRQLPDSFMDDGGQGTSLMEMPFDRDDNQWGEQMNADMLFVLAAALGLASFTLPREMWAILPYITVKRSAF